MSSVFKQMGVDKYLFPNKVKMTKGEATAIVGVTSLKDVFSGTELV